MAVTESTYTGNGSTTNYSFTFPYLKTTDIKTSINGTATTAFTLANATTVQFNTAPANSAAIRIYRETDDSKLEAEFFAGSAIKSSDLNDNFNQNLYVTQESNNKIDAAWTTGDETIISSETWASNNTRVATTGAIDGQIDAKIDTALTTDVAAGNKITVTDNSPGSGQITVGVTSGSLVNSDVNASAAIAGTKISPDFGSQNIATTGTVDGRDVSADGIKLDSIETGATADQNASEIRALVESASDSNVFTDADHTKLNAIEANATADQTAAEIRTLVESASDSNVFTDADHTKLNAIEANATADQTVTEIKSLIAGSPLDASHLAANSVGDSEIATGALDNRYYTETESDARYFNVSTGDTIKDGDAFPDNDTTIATTAAINDRIIDLVDDVGGFVPIANETSFPNANPDVNNGTGTIVSIGALAGNLTSNGSGVITIANGTVGNSTVTITGAANSTTYSAGYGLLVETTSTLNTYTFHRLSSKATEVSTVAGNISNINAVANNASNINSAVSNASNINSAVSNASNINSAVSNASNINTVAGNNTNINTVAGANSNISTVAGSISNVNNVGGSIANVNTVATNISNVNDFSDKYRVASSAPTSSLDTGDLYFDTSANELKVYNGSAWQGGVTATGNLAGLGANTFTGNQSLGDNLKVQLGTGNDLQIYHDGTDSYLLNNTGQLILRTASVDSSVVCKPNAATELYYDGVKKLETSSTGGILRGTMWTAVDNTKVAFGTGDDLQIYHDGTQSHITESGTGLLYINSNATVIRNSAGNENQITAEANGAVSLYYDNSKKFETTSGGATVTGTLIATANVEANNNMHVGDSKKYLAGNSNDLQIYHSSNHSYIKNSTNWLRIGSNYLALKNDAFDEDYLTAEQNGSVDLYYDNAKHFETTSTGVKCTGDFRADDDYRIKLGTSQELNIFHHNSGVSVIENTDQVLKLRAKAGENGVLINPDGAVELYYDGSKKYETYADGSKFYGHQIGQTAGSYIQVTGANSNAFAIGMTSGSDLPAGSDNHLQFHHWNNSSWDKVFFVHRDYINLPDNKKLNVGDSNDLQIYHDSSNGNSYIKEVTANQPLRICSSDLQFRNDADSHLMARIISDAAVQLYYDNSKKFETTASGVTVTGTVSDSKGNLRNIPQNNQTSSAYTLVAADAGKHIHTDQNITIPNSVFAVGDAITIVSIKASDLTITQASGLTMFNAADASTGNRILATRGMVTILFTHTSYAYISGAGLS